MRALSQKNRCPQIFENCLKVTTHTDHIQNLIPHPQHWKAWGENQKLTYFNMLNCALLDHPAGTFAEMFVTPAKIISELCSMVGPTESALKSQCTSPTGRMFKKATGTPTRHCPCASCVVLFYRHALSIKDLLFTSFSFTCRADTTTISTWNCLCAPAGPAL